MGSVVNEGGTLVVVAGGQRRRTSVTVSASMSEADVTSAVQRAVSSQRTFYEAMGGDAWTDFQRISASGSSRSIYRAMHPAEERREEPRREERRERREPRREERREEPRPRREERRDVRSATPRRSFPEQATEVIPWITQQLRESGREERKAVAAAGTLHTNREFLNQYLSPELQRGTLRTSNQSNATIAVFNALYEIPSFRLYLSSVAATQRDSFPGFVRLQEFLTQPGRPELLDEQANAEIIRAADMYIRFFLFGFVAPNSANSRYREEIRQLTQANWVTERVAEARTFTARSGRQPTEADRNAFVSMYVGGPMDSDTVVAASLFIRRWTQEHPERGRSRSQDQIAQWQAPAVVPLEGTAQAQPQAPVAAVPRVGIIGDSMVAGGRIGTTLQRILREQSPDAAVDSYGVVGESLSAIRARLRRDIFYHQPPYNTVILEGGVNGIIGRNETVDAAVTRLQGEFTRMVRECKDRGLRVMVMTLNPWAGYQTSTDQAQQVTTRMNQWLAGRPFGADVTIIDISAIGEGNPPRLRAALDSGDHIHPNNSGRDEIARIAARSGFGRTISAQETNTALQEFADANWRNLSSELYQSARNGRPAGIVTLMRNLPPTHTSLDAALRDLHRTDINDAFDRIFNDYLHSDSGFLQFCRGRQEFQGIAREATRLSSSTTAQDRRMVLRAIGQYLNNEAQRSGDVYDRLRQDLAMLYRQVFSMGRDDYDATGVSDMRLMAAIAVYSWRMANQAATVGDWAQSIQGVRREQQRRDEQRQEPPPQPVQPQPGGRRRVITPG